MDELLETLQSEGVHLLFDEVFDGLHVVVRRGLDLLHAGCVGLGEVAVYGPQVVEACRIEIGQLRQRQLAQGDEIFHLDTYAVADQCLFGEIGGQRLGSLAVAAVDGRNGGKGGQHVLSV